MKGLGTELIKKVIYFFHKLSQRKLRLKLQMLECSKNKALFRHRATISL